MADSRRNGSSSKTKKNPSGSLTFSCPRDIPKSYSGRSSGGGGSSAPVDIPDWSKILKKKPKRNLWDDSCHQEDEDENYFRADDVASDEDDDDGVRIPPHEYLARRLASTQIASHSMCEGVGRTLKGRDLSKVRNAVLTRTGFIE